ncbi:lipoprotein Spr [Enterobacillus tribolii]|uniref:Lipoprotein Spr n=1 Tax=Enterobacillus tribolii TaxID=1487935 RepID=A0A370QHW1_9GAMM|nr:glycoside hydrolase [Enterobacillus tribolii]RDK87951.1 lipoprotein Spr [Enterobacillus tribolii]
MLFNIRNCVFAATIACASLSLFSLPASASSSLLPQNSFTQKINNTTTIKNAISSVYAKWKGVHYRFGGSTKRGVDCSALMQHVFSDTVDMHLPRTTREQIKLGTRISKNELRTGDLVFFKTSRYQRHVGVYIGNNQFMHASKRKGVTISSLDNSYWVRHYESARRVVDDYTA